MLKDLGCGQVQSALDGRKALKMLANQLSPPQFLVCDIFMPEMDGFEFLEKLAALPFNGGIVLLTGGDHEMLRMARDIAVFNRLNVVGAFLKPVASEQMASAIAALSP
jgi:CheY-like chemotaxis protein